MAETHIEFVCLDKDNNLVICYTERWAHIARYHSSMLREKVLIAAVVASPQCIYAYPDNPARINLYKSLVRPGKGNILLLVVLEYKKYRKFLSSNYRLELITTYFTPRVKMGGRLIWGRPI